MSQYRIISIYQRAINQEGAPLITKQGTVWEKKQIYCNIKATQTRFRLS